MSGEVAHYDVDYARETAERNARYYTDRAVGELAQEIRVAITELRRELDSLTRVLNSRTEHLA